MTLRFGSQSGDRVVSGLIQSGNNLVPGRATRYDFAALARAGSFVNFKNASEHRFFRPAVGALLVTGCGLALWALPLTQSWTDASYDDLFRFGSRAITNQVVVVQMDDSAALALGTSRAGWNRSLHAQLLDKLTADGNALTVFDVHFGNARNPATDEKLAEAMRRNGHVVLMAGWTELSSPGAQAEEPILPNSLFLQAATNWGIGKLEAVNAPVRRHWPFPAPVEGRPSLAWTAALVAGAKLSPQPTEQWVRYYGEDGGLVLMSYDLALAKPPEFFHGKVVFIGNQPEQLDPNVYEADKFRTPYTVLTGRSVGGVKILATEFLNLMHHDWLRRAPGWVEFFCFGITGILLGGGLCRFRRMPALGVAFGAAIGFSLFGVCLSYFTNFWFPWLIVAGGQIPCALAWAILPTRGQPVAQPRPAKVASNKTIVLSFPEEPLPDAPEYELLTPHIGKGGFGKVWIARNAIGQWQALKAVYASSFGENRHPYESEFKGLQRYKPVSEKHPGLLRIELISRMKEEGYFYYVMELGDAQVPGWETQPALYKPRDLDNLRKQVPDRRLPVAECLRIVTILADALNFLHNQGLTHRDIKPSNVIFVNGRPKLADIGLVADIRPGDEIKTMVGTPGYMPPPPEPPGTPQADIYALGMLLYVISTGSDPGFFPDLSTTLMQRSGHEEFIRLNVIILKACQPDLARRYTMTSEMFRDLQEAAKAGNPVN